MKHQEGTFQGSGATTLFYQCWRPDERPKATLLIVHGIGEHSGRYMNLVNYFVPRGYAIYSFDHRGHGRSPGLRGHINKWAELRGDVQNFVQMVATQAAERPLFLFGHSLGGLIVAEYVLHHAEGLHGVLISAPALGTSGVSPLLVFIANIMSIIRPTFALETGLDVNGISRETAVVEAYKADPLVHGKASARLGAEIQKAITWTQTHAHEWSLPLLMWHGEADTLTNPADSHLFFDKITYPIKTYLSYPNGRHESHNDLHRAELFASIDSWLTSIAG